MSTLRQYSAGFSTSLGGLFTRDNFKSLLVFWLPVFLASAFIGLCCVILPWILPLGLAAAIAYVATLSLLPWVGFSAYMVLAMVAPDLKIADVLTVLTMAVLVFRLFVYKQSVPAFPRRLFFIAITFAAIVVVSFGLGIVYFHNTVPNIYRDGRVFLYWLWLPIVWVMVAGQPDGLQKLVRALVAVAFIVVTLAIFQWVTGIQIVASGLVASLGVTSGFKETVTRVQMPGFLFVTWAIIWLALQILYKRVNFFVGGLLMLVLFAGLYVNFGRGLWTWTFIGMLIPLFFVGGGRSAKLIAALVLGGVLGVGALAIVKPSVLENISERVLSVQNEGGRRTSYGWRALENRESMITLQRSPLFGVGVGGEYRPWLHELRLFPDHVRYVHNSYLFVAIKLGIPGLLCLLALCWRAWNEARKRLPVVAAQDRVPLLACLAFLPASFGLSITQPELMNPNSVLLFVAVIAALAHASMHALPEKTAADRKKGNSWH